MHCTSYCVPFIKETKSKYSHFNFAVIISSSRTSTPRKLTKGEAIYASTKWGLLGFTECSFKELKESGMKVSAILPGWCNTNQPQRYNEDEINWDKTVQVMLHVLLKHVYGHKEMQERQNYKFVNIIGTYHGVMGRYPLDFFPMTFLKKKTLKFNKFHWNFSNKFLCFN